MSGFRHLCDHELQRHALSQATKPTSTKAPNHRGEGWAICFSQEETLSSTKFRTSSLQLQLILAKLSNFLPHLSLSLLLPGLQLVVLTLGRHLDSPLWAPLLSIVTAVCNTVIQSTPLSTLPLHPGGPAAPSNTGCSALQAPNETVSRPSMSSPPMYAKHKPPSPPCRRCQV